MTISRCGEELCNLLKAFAFLEKITKSQFLISKERHYFLEFRGGGILAKEVSGDSGIFPLDLLSLRTAVLYMCICWGHSHCLHGDLWTARSVDEETPPRPAQHKPNSVCSLHLVSLIT